MNLIIMSMAKVLTLSHMLALPYAQSNLPTPFLGNYDPIWEINDEVRRLNAEKGWQVVSVYACIITS